MSTDLTTRNVALDPWKAAQAFKASGMFPDLQSEAQAYVKILAGQELGLGPMAAVGGLNVIKGKVTFSANLLAAQVKRNPKYDYRVVAHDEKVCRIEFTQDGEVNGVSEFSMEDAKRAGLSGHNWSKYPQAMMFARALTQGVRWYCPDVTAGSAAYTAEELGGEPEAVEAEVVEAPVEDPRLAELRRVADGIGVPLDVRQAIGEWIHETGELDEKRVSQAVAAMNAGETGDLLAKITLDAEPVEEKQAV